MDNSGEQIDEYRKIYCRTKTFQTIVDFLLLLFFRVGVCAIMNMLTYSSITTTIKEDMAVVETFWYVLRPNIEVPLS